MTHTDAPVFDVANDNVNALDAAFDNPIDMSLPSARVSGRSAQRFEKVDGEWVAIKPPKAVSKPAPAENMPRMAFRGEWVGNTFYPDTSQARLDRVEIEHKAKDGERIIAAERHRHTIRQAIGNPAADNQNEHWPLITALRRDKDTDSIAFVLKYRKLVALAACEPLQGLRVLGANLELVRIDRNNLGEENKAAFCEMKPDDTALKGGEIKQGHVRKRIGVGFDLPARKAVAANDETQFRTAPLAHKFSCDLLIEQIDAKPVLAEVRRSIGAVLDSFEDAVLGGKTYAEIGEKAGFSVKPDVAGKALVKAGILAAETTLHDIERRIRRAEKRAERESSLARCKIAVEKARYFGRAV